MKNDSLSILPLTRSCINKSNLRLKVLPCLITTCIALQGSTVAAQTTQNENIESSNQQNQATTSNQNNADNIEQETVITASRQKQTRKNAIANTTVINRAAIERSGVNDILTLLRREASFEYYQSGGQGSQSAIFMRGSNSNQTLVLIDGIALSHENSNGAIRLEHIPIEQIERVEIVRGNVSAIYGSQAMGGVINIITRQATTPFSTNASITVSSRKGNTESVGISGKQEYANYSLQLANTSTRGFSAIDPTFNKNANPDNDGYRNRNLSFKLGLTPTKNQELGFQGLLINTKTDFDDPFSSFDHPEKDIQVEKTSTKIGRIFYQVNPVDNWQSRLSVSVNRERRENKNNDKHDFVLLTRTQNWQWHNDFFITPEHKIQLGADRSNTSIETEDSYSTTPFDHSRRSHDIYAGYQGQFKTLGWEVQLRRDSHQESEKATSKSFGLHYEFLPGFSAFGKYATAFNAPTLSQMYTPTYGNLNLKPEKSHSRELALQYNDKYQLWRLSYFNTHYRDLFSFDANTFQNINIGRARNKGLELTGELRWQGLSFKASATHQNPKDTSTDTPQELLRRAKNFGNIGVAYDQEKWGANLNWLISGKRIDSVFNDITFKNERIKLPGYGLVSIGAYYNLTPELKAKVALDNAFNRKYELVRGYNTTPRTISFTLAWQQK